MTRHPQEVDQSYKRHMGGQQLRIITRKATIELAPESNADGEDQDGFPDWVHRIGLYSGPCYMNGTLTRDALVTLHDALTKYLGVPTPPTRVVVTIERTRRTKRKTTTRRAHDPERTEREAIKKEMRR